VSDSDNLEEAKAGLLKDELVDYELDQDDIGLLDLELADSPEEGFHTAPPVLAIVGRPKCWQVRSGQQDSGP